MFISFRFVWSVFRGVFIARKQEGKCDGSVHILDIFFSFCIRLRIGQIFCLGIDVISFNRFCSV